MKRLRAAEQRLLAFSRSREQNRSEEPTEERQAAGDELDELTEAADEPRPDERKERKRVNAELQQDEDDAGVRLGPLSAMTGPDEPVWIAVPLRSEGEEGEQRAEEQAVSHESETQEPHVAAVRDDKHVHRQLPEDRAAGRPQAEMGVSTAQHCHMVTDCSRRISSRSLGDCLCLCIGLRVTGWTKKAG